MMHARVRWTPSFRTSVLPKSAYQMSGRLITNVVYESGKYRTEVNAPIEVFWNEQGGRAIRSVSVAGVSQIKPLTIGTQGEPYRIKPLSLLDSSLPEAFSSLRSNAFGSRGW